MTSSRVLAFMIPGIMPALGGVQDDDHIVIGVHNISLHTY
jgi:hypothetical protein